MNIIIITFPFLWFGSFPLWMYSKSLVEFENKPLHDQAFGKTFLDQTLIQPYLVFKFMWKYVFFYEARVFTKRTVFYLRITYCLYLIILAMFLSIFYMIVQEPMYIGKVVVMCLDVLLL